MAKNPDNPRKTTPKAVVDQIKRDLASAPKHERGKLERIADKWGVTLAVVDHIGQREKRDIMLMREKIEENSYLLSARLDERIVEALEDNEKMAATGLRDMAQAREKLITSGAVARDGLQHLAPTVNIAFVKEAKRSLEDFDRRQAALRAQAKPVVALP